MIKAIVFDLDGTLLYTLPDIAAALNAALAEEGCPTWAVDDYRRFVGSGIRTAIRRAAPPDLPPEALERIYRTYQSIYPDHCADRTAYYPGIHDALRVLRDRGLALGVLSNKTEATGQKIVARYFPDIPFAFVWGNNGARPLKPDAAGAAAFLALLGLPAEQAAYVGDSDVDMLFAQNAGLLPVGAVWGYRGREELAQAGAAALAEHPAQLPELLA